MTAILVYEPYINAFLVEKGVRDAYLIQNFESTDTEVIALINNIQVIFPNLKVLVYNNYYYLSKRELKTEDVNSSEKIAKVLRFECDVNFEDLDRNKETIDYNVDVYMKGNTEPITLITYVCQTDNLRDAAIKLVDDIRQTLMNDPYLKTMIRKVELMVNVTMPALSFLPKLMDLSYVFNVNEIQHLDNIIYNIMNEDSSKKIIDAIDYANPIHRGLMIGYIGDYQHHVLEPLYPLQSTGYMDQIYEIEKKKTALLLGII
jgi:hypothetical protein